MSRNKLQLSLSGWLATGLLSAGLLAGCMEADVVDDDNPAHPTGGGKTIEASFDMQIIPGQAPDTRSIAFTARGTVENDTLPAASADTLQTRATDPGTVQEQMVSNVWVGQYDAATHALLAQTYLPAVPADKKVTVRLKYSETDINSNIWFVANAGDLNTTAPTAIQNENSLKAYKLSCATSNGNLTDNLCIMTGLWTGLVPSTGFIESQPVDLTRVPAKFTFSYTINQTDSFSFTPTSLVVENVPTLSQLDVATTQLSGTQYISYTTPLSAADHTKTIVCYQPENMAGNGSAVATLKDRIGDGVQHATRIVLYGSAVQNNVNYGNISICFYPGDMTHLANYDIRRNGHYKMDIALGGLDVTDKRITIGSVPQTVSPVSPLPAAKGGTQRVQITARPGLEWVLDLPLWLSAKLPPATTPGDSIPVHAGTSRKYRGPVDINFKAEESNPRATPRSVTFAIPRGDQAGTTDQVTLTQSGSVLQDVSTGITIGAAVGSTAPFSFTATRGLAWDAILNDSLYWHNPSEPGSETTGSQESHTLETNRLNPSGTARSLGSITLRVGASMTADDAGLSQVIPVTQAGATVAISGGTSVSIGAVGGTGSFAFTATPGLYWTAASANADWISLTGASTGTTPSGAVSVPYSVPMNMTTSERTGSITVRAGDPSNGPSATLNITQAGAVFNLSANVLTLNCLEVTDSSITLTGTPGLAWTVTPSTETNGIAPQTTGGTANGSPQAITFHATKNDGVATRTATFTVSVPASPSLAKTITINQEGIAVTINQDILTKYVARLISMGYDLTIYPPFDTDGDHGTAVKTKHGIDFTLNGTSSTMTGSYQIQVQSTQVPKIYSYLNSNDYCSNLNVDGHADWRLPTQIECYAMWDKAKGTNGDASDNEPDSQIFGAPFIGSIYWTSSVYGGNADKRCLLRFTNGSLTWYGTSDSNSVRCVRDL